MKDEHDSGPFATDAEIRQKIKEGWVFPHVLAKRWGVAESTVRRKAYRNELVNIRSQYGLILLDPSQSISGKIK